MLIAAAVIALLIPIGIGGWFAFGRDGGSSELADEPDDPKTTDKPDKPKTTDEPDKPTTNDEPDEPTTTDTPAKPAGGDGSERVWPTDPQLRHSISIRMDPEDRNPYVPVVGTADDLFVADWFSGATSTVTHYVDGERAWRAEVGLGKPGYISFESDMMLYYSYGTDNFDSQSIARLDPESGVTMWEITADMFMILRVVDDRVFVIEDPLNDDAETGIVEYDAQTGNELNRAQAPRVRWADDQLFSVDPVALTAQLLDLDFRPVGDPVPIERSGAEYYPFVVEPYAGGWLYFTNSGGAPTVIGLSPTGDKEFDCEVTVDEPSSIDVIDDSTISVGSWKVLEILDLDGGGCAPRWSYRAEGDNTGITVYPDYPKVTHNNYDGPDGGLVDVDIDVLDWETGDIIASGKNQAYIDDNGDLLTFVDNKLVSSSLSTGKVNWSIDAPGTTDLHTLGFDKMFAIVTTDGDSGTVDIYTD